MVDALESGEPSAVVAFDAHGKAKAYGESEKDFAARRKSWLVEIEPFLAKLAKFPSDG
jgi:hypothetical protein